MRVAEECRINQNINAVRMASFMECTDKVAMQNINLENMNEKFFRKYQDIANIRDPLGKYDVDEMQRALCKQNWTAGNSMNTDLGRNLEVLEFTEKKKVLDCWKTATMKTLYTRACRENNQNTIYSVNITKFCLEGYSFAKCTEQYKCEGDENESCDSINLMDACKGPEDFEKFYRYHDCRSEQSFNPPEAYDEDAYRKCQRMIQGTFVMDNATEGVPIKTDKFGRGKMLSVTLVTHSTCVLNALMSMGLALIKAD